MPVNQTYDQNAVNNYNKSIQGNQDQDQDQSVKQVVVYSMEKQLHKISTRKS